MIHLMSRLDEREVDSCLAIVMVHSLTCKTQSPTRRGRNTIHT